MDAAEQQHKLAMIRELPRAELLGWWAYVHGWRAPFGGEIAALISRAQMLGVSLPAARSVSATGTAMPQMPTSPSMKF
jgi:hypothetical protein